ncbi:MAG TPA: peptidoglycan-binding protein [Kofleriaceae bacterium]
MSFERTHAHSGSHSSTAHAAPAATPGKQTQVALLSQSSGHHEEAAASVSGVNLATLQDFIARHEGNVDHVYLDSRGFPTAGIGHLLTGGHFHVGQKISREQITAWFKQDVAKAIAGAKRDIGGAFDRLDEARKIVVIDMVFNLGAGGFGQFHATIQAIRTGHFAQAADHMLQSLWARQVGHRATEDAAIMRSGHMSGTGGGGGHPAPSHGGGGHGGGSHAPTLAQVRSGHGALEIGDTGAAVKEVQHLLHVSADGMFGPHTQHAVKTFQRAHHLAVDGIVGKHTLAALEHGAHPEPHKDHGGKPPAHDHGKWQHAPSLDAVKSGKATLHVGEQGAAVKHVQHLLAVDADGKFGPMTRTAVAEFQRAHHEGRHDGAIDAHTLALLTRHPVGSIEGESRDGAAQRHKMLSVARSASAGRRPDGRCYFHVCHFFIQCGGYGKIKNPYTQFPSSALPEAHDFADLMNSRGPAHFGLERLAIHNPYDAPAGAIVVVAAGSPGTHHPTAGDSAIAGGDGAFYNGGLMGYSGRAGWEASRRARLLGCYIPR